MTREELEKIKDFIYNVLMVFQNQDEFLADDSGLGNFENPMFDKARSYILKKKKIKQIKKISLVCDRCGEHFKANVMFDKNGVSISQIPRLCSKCIVEVKK